MSPIPSGRMKKYEPLDSRGFVSFIDFYELSLENINIACERHYRLPRNSCDVLVSDRRPSCTRIEQIKGKKVFLVRFLENREQRVGSPDKFVPSTPGNFLVPVTTISNVTDGKHVATPPSVFAQSVLIAAMLKAEKLVKRQVPETLSLECFDLQSIIWKRYSLKRRVLRRVHFERNLKLPQVIIH